MLIFCDAWAHPVNAIICGVGPEALRDMGHTAGAVRLTIFIAGVYFSHRSLQAQHRNFIPVPGKGIGGVVNKAI